MAAFTSLITRSRPRSYSAPAAEVISGWAIPLIPSMSTEMNTRSAGSSCAAAGAARMRTTRREASRPIGSGPARRDTARFPATL